MPLSFRWWSALLSSRRSCGCRADAVWIVILGTVIGGIFGWLFTGIIAAIIQLIIWVALVKHFFDTGWLTALGIGIVAVVIFVVITVILGLIGFAIWALI